MSRLELIGVRKRFGRVSAVRELSLTVESAELVALVGPSGCGKTTLLRMIAGFEQPDEGDIRVDGASILGVPPEGRRIGLVFQEHALFPHMSVAANIGYGLRFAPRLGRREREQRVHSLLELVGLAELGARAPHELSSGQRQRVALARALAPSPSVLLLDEPLSSLDAPLREELRLHIARLQRELKLTTIHVTHDQEEALAIADRVALMRDGLLEQVASPSVLYEKPETEFAARFIGRGNVLAGSLIEAARGTATVRLRGGAAAEVALDGADAAAGAAAGAKPGAEVGVLVRPGRLVVGAGRHNRIEGSVAGVDYTGEGARLRLLYAGEEISLEVAPSESAGWRSRIGERVVVSFDAADARILRSDRSERIL